MPDNFDISKLVPRAAPQLNSDMDDSAVIDGACVQVFNLLRSFRLTGGTHHSKLIAAGYLKASVVFLNDDLYEHELAASLLDHWRQHVATTIALRDAEVGGQS